MAQIEVLDLDNACSLSELSCETTNVVSGGAYAVYLATKNPYLAYLVYKEVKKKTGSVWKASAASLSNLD